MTSTTTPTILRTWTDNDGDKWLSVEPYRTETRYGDPVEVECFYVLFADVIVAWGRRVRKNGETYARQSDLNYVAVPASIRAALLGD